MRFRFPHSSLSLILFNSLSLSVSLSHSQRRRSSLSLLFFCFEAIFGSSLCLDSEVRDSDVRESRFSEDSVAEGLTEAELVAVLRAYARLAESQARPREGSSEEAVGRGHPGRCRAPAWVDAAPASWGVPDLRSLNPEWFYRRHKGRCVWIGGHLFPDPLPISWDGQYLYGDPWNRPPRPAG